MLEQETVSKPKGHYFCHMEDATTGEVLAHFEGDNIITLDEGIAMSRLCASPAATYPGIRMLAVGTGGSGAATSSQRSLNAEIFRKALSNRQYRDASGNATGIPTNVVDYTCTLGVGEAAGAALNEMGLLLPFDLITPAPGNPIGAPTPWLYNPPNPYDPTFDVTRYDILFNYATFGVVTKPAGAVLTWTWRITR